MARDWITRSRRGPAERRLSGAPTGCSPAPATDAQLEELCRIAQQRSPVFDIVSNPVPVDVRVAR
jgi:hypothetical protein